MLLNLEIISSSPPHLHTHTQEHSESIFLTILNSLCFQDDFANNREFITMVVYKTDGKKVYYPGMFSKQTFKQTLKFYLCG